MTVLLAVGAFLLALCVLVAVMDAAFGPDEDIAA